MALRYLLPGQMYFMSQHGFDVVMISADGKELSEVINKEQCRHIVVQMTRRITPFQDLKCLIQLILIFKKEKPDIVHSHTPKAGLLGMLAARICGVKIRIHTVAGLPLMVEKGFKYHLLKFIEKLTYAAANHVWPNSHSLMQFIKDHGLTSSKKLHIIGKGSTNGLNTVRFNSSQLSEERLTALKTQINFNKENTYLLCIGRLVADKGIVELVEVFLKLQEKNPLLKLILAGEFEPELDPLPATILKEIASNNSILHVGWINNVEYYMKVSSFFIFPSHREGFPNVLLQAGAMGLPVICSRIAGNIDIVANNETGLIFDAGNQVQMLQLIQYAIAHPQHMQTMATQLQQNVIENFQQENIWQKMHNAYNSLLN